MTYRDASYACASMRVRNGYRDTDIAQAQLAEAMLYRDVGGLPPVGGFARDRVQFTRGHALVRGVIESRYARSVILLSNCSDEKDSGAIVIAGHLA